MLVYHAEGRYPVGATTLTLPVRPTRQFGSATFVPNTMHGSGPILNMSEIAFSVYYPTTPELRNSKKDHLDWLIRYVMLALVLRLLLNVYL
jgi:hypothetical protein